MSLPTTQEVTPVEAITALLASSAESQAIIEDSTTVNDGETQSIEDGETVLSGDALIGGTLNVGGTLSIVGGLTPWSTIPSVFKWWDRSEKERGPGQNQKPELYVRESSGLAFERLTADNTLLEESPSVEIYVYSLSESQTSQLANDVIDFMALFISEKEQNTEFAGIIPTSVEDFREQKLRQKTDHFVYSIEVEITKLTDTGV